MNTIARLLFTIGWVCIVAGFVLGFTNYQTVIPEVDAIGGIEYVEQESIATFAYYALIGIVAGIMMFGFAEIINLLDKIHRSINGNSGTAPETKNKEVEVSKYDQFIQDSINK